MYKFEDLEEDFISEEVEFFPRQVKGRNKKYEAARKNLIKDKKKLFSNWIEAEFWETKDNSKQLEPSILNKKTINQLNEKLFFYGKPVRTVSYCNGVYIGPKIEKIIKPFYDFCSYKQLAKFRKGRKQKTFSKKTELHVNEASDNELYEERTFEYFLNKDILESFNFPWTGEISLRFNQTWRDIDTNEDLDWSSDLDDPYYWTEDPYYWDWDHDSEYE